MFWSNVVLIARIKPDLNCLTKEEAMNSVALMTVFLMVCLNTELYIKRLVEPLALLLRPLTMAPPVAIAKLLRNKQLAKPTEPLVIYKALPVVAIFSLNNTPFIRMVELGIDRLAIASIVSVPGRLIIYLVVNKCRIKYL